MMKSKDLRLIFKLFYFLWGTYSLLLVAISTFTDITKVFNGSVQISSLFWFLGQIPAVFFVVYLISIKLKNNILLKKLASTLALLSFLVFVMFFITSGFNLPLFLATLFPLSIFIKTYFFKTVSTKGTMEKQKKGNETVGMQNTSVDTNETKILVFILIIVALVLAFLYGQSLALESARKEKVKGDTTSAGGTLSPTPTITLTPIPKKATNKTTVSNSSLIDCIGPDGKEFKTSEAECKKLNESWGKPVDYIINCGVHSNCGGGTRRLKKSECDNSTCCQIGSSWFFYTSKDKCSQDQRNNTTQTTQRTPGNNFYCWNNAYGYAYYTSSGDQCNLDNLKSGTYKTCMDTQKIKNDTCKLACSNELDKDRTACAWAYTGPNPGIEQSTDKYGECLNGPGGAGELYGTCLGKCSDQYAQDIKQCSSQ